MSAQSGAGTSGNSNAAGTADGVRYGGIGSQAPSPSGDGGGASVSSSIISESLVEAGACLLDVDIVQYVPAPDVVSPQQLLGDAALLADDAAQRRRRSTLSTAAGGDRGSVLRGSVDGFGSVGSAATFGLSGSSHSSGGTPSKGGGKGRDVNLLSPTGGLYPPMDPVFPSLTGDWGGMSPRRHSAMSGFSADTNSVPNARGRKQLFGGWVVLDRLPCLVIASVWRRTEVGFMCRMHWMFVAECVWLSG